MSNSNLVSYTKISPNSTNPREHKIDKITIHHMAGNASVEKCGDVFAPTSRQASSNYGIGSDGRIALYVDEGNRAWTSGNAENDHRAITIEVANDGGAPDWHVSDKALEALISLCTDICRRNGIKALNFTGDKNGNLTMHKWFQATACPGPYLESKFPYIAKEVNKRLASSSGLYRVQVGAFSNKANAEALLGKLKAAGFDGFIVEEIAAPTATPEPAPAPKKTIQVGSTVRVNKGAKSYAGGSIASFVYKRDHKVHQISGDRAVITYDGVVVAAVRVSDLTLV